MQIIMPKLGLTMTHGTITEWLKAPGDTVKAEEALCAYETEKVTLEMPAPEDGVLAEILAPAGTTVAAGTPVCEFWTKDDGRWTMDDGQASGVRRQASGIPQGGFAQEPGRAAIHRLQPPASSFQPPSPLTPRRRHARWRGSWVWTWPMWPAAVRRDACRPTTWKPPKQPHNLSPSRQRRLPAASPRPRASTCAASPAPARKGRSRARMWKPRSGVRTVRSQESGVRGQDSRAIGSSRDSHRPRGSRISIT